MGGTHPRSMSERTAQHSHPTMRRNTSCIHDRKGQHSHLTIGGTNPASMSERLCTYIWPWEEHIQHSCQKGYALTSDHERNTSSIHVRRSHEFITFFWREPRSGEHQDSPWSTQTSLWPMVLSTHQLSIRPSQHTGASLLLSAPYPWYSDTWSWYALTFHGILDSLTTLHNSGCHSIYK